MEYSGAGGETDSWKKPEAKNLLTLYLSSKVETFSKSDFQYANYKKPENTNS